MQRFRSALCVVTFVVVGTCHAVPAAAEETVGWRGDGSGRYPQATPPTVWSSDKQVAWKTPLPGKGFGSPILLGDRLYVSSEPAELLCIDAADGRILWQVSATIADVLDEDRAQEVTEQFQQIQAEEKEVRRALGKINKENAEERERVKERSQQLKEQLRELQQQFPVSHGRAGNTAGTPTSDGRVVYAAFGTGIVTAVTLEGRPLWTRFVEGSPLGFGHSSSPVLVDGKLVVHYKDLVALDASSGDEVWRVELSPRYATPLATRIGDEHVLMTPSGAIFRTRDGVRIANAEFNTSECTPILHDGVLYAHQNGRVTAFRLPTEIAEEFAFERLWTSSSARERRTPSAVLHDGLLYGVTTSGILEVQNAQTGAIAYRKRLNEGKFYSSVTAAGDYIYISNTKGTTIVLKAGAQYEELSRNELESTGSCPMFVGRRMYVRGNQHLYCIEETQKTAALGP